MSLPVRALRGRKGFRGRGDKPVRQSDFINTMRPRITYPGLLFFAAGLIGLLVSTLETRPVFVSAKDLPIPTTVGELSAEPGQFDGHRVFVTGRVRTITVERGRRGSEFLAMTLEEVSPERPGGPSVRVFSLDPFRLSQGNRISVQGTYHREGRFGGLPYEEFIEADAILREK